MCPKNTKAPIFLIGGVCFVIILVAICGITLINNINLSNIIRLNEKVASDSMSPSNHHEPSEDYDNDNNNHPNTDNRGGGKEFNLHEANYGQNHPKNIYRFDKETGMMSNINSENIKQQQQQQSLTSSLAAATTSTLTTTTSVGLNADVAVAANADSAVKSFWQNDKIITNERNIDTLQIQEINAIASASSSAANTNSSPSLSQLKASTLTSTTTTTVIDNDLLNHVLDSTFLTTTPSSLSSSASSSSAAAASVSTPRSPSVLVISDKNTSMIDYEKRAQVVEVSCSF